MRGVVCISHAEGAGGEEVARLVADRLGFLCVDAEIVAQAAARGGLAPADVADAERRRSLVRRVLEAVSEAGGTGWGGFAPPFVAEDVSSEEVRALIREAISETAARGQVVIVGHAASHSLAPSADRLRVLVTASPATRAKRAGDDEPADLARAGKLVTASDAGRADYLKRFYGINRELPTHYDLVVNTDALSLEAAAVLISQAASGLDVPARPGRAAPER